MVTVVARSNGPVSAADALQARVERIATGLTDWDAALSGGAVAGTSSLFYGRPGAGKSTEALRLAAAVARATGRRALVLSNEMIAEHLAGYCARLELPLESIDVWHEPSWRVARRALGGPYGAIVVDAVQPYASRDGDVGRVLRDLAEVTGAVRLLIARVNSRGEPSGRRDLEHDVDAVIRVTHRTIEVVKSRYCDAPTSVARVVSSRSGDRPAGGGRRSGRRPPLRLVE